MSIQQDVVLATCPVCEKPLVNVPHAQQCGIAIRRERRGYQIMTRCLGAALNASLPESLRDSTIRVSGEAICSKCSLEYRKHPEVFPTFHLGCDGVLLKT